MAYQGGYGSNPNLAASSQEFGSTHNLGSAQYFGSMHDIPDRQVVSLEASAAAGYNDKVKYADLDHKAFMIPKNQVLPKMDKLEYAELQVSRSKIV
jgi:hypothetical protein